MNLWIIGDRSVDSAPVLHILIVQIKTSWLATQIGPNVCTLSIIEVGTSYIPVRQRHE